MGERSGAKIKAIENWYKSAVIVSLKCGAKTVRFLNRDMVWQAYRHVSRIIDTSAVCIATDRDYDCKWPCIFRTESMRRVISVHGTVFAHCDVTIDICINNAMVSAAERGVPSPVIGQMQKCTDQLDTVVAAIEPGSDLSEFIRLNDQFHELLMQCTQSTVIKRSLEREKSLPFAAPNAFVEPALGKKSNTG